MTKVRVSEETPNLSHPSNLISTVRLENPSPSLMRSTRARGRTHSWVVQAFLLREQERGRAEEKRQHLLKESTHPKAKNWHSFQGSRQQGRTGRTVWICGGRTAFNVHRNRGQQLKFLRVLAHIIKLSYSIYWHRNRGNYCNKFLRVFSYSLAQILRVVQHSLQGVVHVGFSVQS
jgi:hypothetical protein